ncbi:Rv1733c family protein [Streptacidiphilus anmyonensis]|uniref:Rv1733c family protein n=1 Tax=Streptacidiphilus anmyonensis TaxID=405782 RepID=UPI00128BDA16|nr:hypothetical protein [Streptacidiphilus anmyonensis]
MPRRQNPLRRRSDSLRDWLPALLALSLSIAGALSILLGVHLYLVLRASADRQAEGLHRVVAVAASQPFQVAVGVGIATLDWTDATGKHAAQTSVPATTRPGDQVPILVDQNGVPRPAPPPAAQSTGTAAAYASAVFAGSVVLLTGGHAWARHALDRRAARAWEEEWALVEPRWNRRNPRG